MKKDQKNKKSSLGVSSETLRLLSASELGKAAGGSNWTKNSHWPGICYLN